MFSLLNKLTARHSQYMPPQNVLLCRNDLDNILHSIVVLHSLLFFFKTGFAMQVFCMSFAHEKIKK